LSPSKSTTTTTTTTKETELEIERAESNFETPLKRKTPTKRNSIILTPLKSTSKSPAPITPLSSKQTQTQQTNKNEQIFNTPMKIPNTPKEKQTTLLQTPKSNTNNNTNTNINTNSTPSKRIINPLVILTPLKSTSKNNATTTTTTPKKQTNTEKEEEEKTEVVLTFTPGGSKLTPNMKRWNVLPTTPRSKSIRNEIENLDENSTQISENNNENNNNNDNDNNNNSRKRKLEIEPTKEQSEFETLSPPKKKPISSKKGKQLIIDDEEEN